ncbi:MAG: tRNA epoxyqueuosine(34) reductase QueG [Candidatus Binatia bacterium]
MGYTASGAEAARVPVHAGARGLQQRIREEARHIGFALCGFVRIEPLAHTDFVRQWLAAGHAAGMGYIARGLAKRLNPRLLVPGARSIITLGYRYLPPPVPPVNWQEQLRGRIAAYALGTDYHLTVAGKLRQLAASITRLHADAVVRLYVDTGPVLEREWAAGGGAGWFGKNTNVLHVHEGSYFFLGELLTNLELDPDPLVPDHCGTCTRCLDLCPTAALKPGYVLDARLCISYLTIEHRGSIPVELRARLGNWIFGCDICQVVCPWNEKLVRRHGAPEAGALLPFLPELLALDAAEFHRRFRRSAIHRAKRDGLVRNVAAALGNTGNPAAVAPLRRALHEDPAHVVRGHAAWALGNIGGHAARRALELARRSEPAGEVRDEIDGALAALA